MATSYIQAKRNKLRRVLTRVKRRVRADRPERVIVSLTSYPARINSVAQAVRTIFAQQYLPDKVVLYLYSGEFPNREAELPVELISLIGFDFEVRWVDRNIRPHKKYYYAMRDFPDDIVITVDDDLLYPDWMISRLLESYERFPRAISGMRTHLICFDSDGSLAKYSDWVMEAPRHYEGLVGVPSMQLFVTTGAGTLFPPHCLPSETFDVAKINELCLNADDVWINVMRTIKRIPAVAATGSQELSYIPGTQDEALFRTNVDQGENDTQLQRVCKEYLPLMGGGSFASLVHDENMTHILQESRSDQ